MRLIANNAETWKTEVECQHCKSILEIEQTDIYRDQFGSMGDYDWEYYIVCMACHLTVKLRDLPGFVEAAVQVRCSRD